MKYTPRVTGDEESVLLDSLEPVAKGLGMAVLELSLCRRKGRGSAGSVQVKVTVYKDGNMGVDDCSRFHRAILPRLELAFNGQDLSVEVSSPGIGRLIKDGSEMAYFIGRNIRCYCSCGTAGSGGARGPGEAAANQDGSGWTGGKLLAADEKGVTLETANGKIVLPYGIIAKAKLQEF
ncbi:MAG: ribosome assembly cofactor RimP [Treponema sp.]|nr:ribosome assembly cofactor RimP [Treponema sp.]